MIDITEAIRHVLPVVFLSKGGYISFDSMYKTHKKHFPNEPLFQYPLTPSEMHKPLESYSFITFDIGMGSDTKTLSRMIDLTYVMKSYLKQKLKQFPHDSYGMACVDRKCVPVCNSCEDCPEGQECSYEEGLCVPAR